MDKFKFWEVFDNISVKGGPDSTSEWLIVAKFSDDVMREIVDQAIAAANFVVQTDEELCKRINANINFDITLRSSEILSRTLSIISVRHKISAKPKSITLKMDAMTFILMLSGKIDGSAGFMSGQIQLSGGGGVPLAMLLQSTLTKKLKQLRSGQLMDELRAKL